MKLRMIFACILAIGGVLSLSPVAVGEEIRRFVMVAGTNRAPTDEMKSLKYADDDAAAHFALFEPTATEAVLLTVMDAETQRRFPGLASRALLPTRNNVSSSLEKLFREIERAKDQGSETEFYFIYSGHGRLLPGREGAITLQDAELTRSDLYAALLEKSPADFNHLIIDACNAYYIVHRRGEDAGWRDDSAGGQRLEVLDFFNRQDLDRFPNTGVLLSTTTEAETHEWSLYQGGIFSHEVRSGLLGAADVTEDGLVEYSEIQAFVRAANHHIGDPKAKLRVYAEPPRQDRNRPIFDLLALSGSTLLDIPERIVGRFYLEDARGGRYADFNKTEEQPLTIALLPGSSYFLRDEEGGREYEIPAVGGRINLARVASRGLSTAAKGAVERTFRANLFTQPFGRGFYSGIVEGLGMVPARRVQRVNWQPSVVSRKDASVDAARRRRVAAWTGLSLGLVTLAGAGTTTYLAVDNAQQYRDSLTNDESLLDKKHAFTYASIGLYAASAVFFGMSIYWFATADRDVSKEQKADHALSSRLKPVGGIIASGGYVGLEGSF